MRHAAIAPDLIERARGGAPADVDELIVRAWPEAYRLAYAVLARHDTAQDAAQEACLVVCRSIASLRSVAAFRVWFARIVVREASAVRKRRIPATATGEPSTEPHDSATSLDIWCALETLSPAMREVVVLRYFEDLTSREIGAVLGIPAPTVRFRLMIALRRLRPLLETVSGAAAPHTPDPEVRSHAC